MVQANYSKPKSGEIVSSPKFQCIFPKPIASLIDHHQSQNYGKFETASIEFQPSRKRRTSTQHSYVFTEEIPTKRSRGRPPKTGPTEIPAEKLKKLSPPERKYVELRLKNNEASRLSRFNRKTKDLALFDEEVELKKRNDELKQIDSKLDAKIKRLREEFTKFVTNIKNE